MDTAGAVWLVCVYIYSLSYALINSAKVCGIPVVQYILLLIINNNMLFQLLLFINIILYNIFFYYYIIQQYYNIINIITRITTNYYYYHETYNIKYTEAVIRQKKKYKLVYGVRYSCLGIYLTYLVQYVFIYIILCI